MDNINTYNRKSVRFNDNNIHTVFIMRTWLFAMKTSRKGEWHFDANDRARFKYQKINPIGKLLQPILEKHIIIALKLKNDHSTGEP